MAGSTSRFQSVFGSVGGSGSSGDSSGGVQSNVFRFRNTRLVLLFITEDRNVV